MNPAAANMAWGMNGQSQGQGPGGVCSPNAGQLSVVATVWGVTTSTQSGPMSSQAMGGYGSGGHGQMGNTYCGNSGMTGAGGAGNNGNFGPGMPAGQMSMTKGGSYVSGGGTGRHMGSGYGTGYVSRGIY